MSRLRTLIVGFGKVAAGMADDPKMARYFDYASHASALAAHQEFDWLGVVDPDPAAQHAARETWKVPHVGGDLATVAAAVKPDVAVIATPPGQRAEILRQLPGIKAVLIEKPLDAPATNDGAQVAALAAARNLPVLVNYWRRADRQFQDLASGGLKAHIGRAQAATFLYGNGLKTNGSHMIDFARMLLGEVAAVQALGPAVPAPGAPLAGDPAVAFALTLDSGLVATFQPLDFRRYREVGLDIWGEEGRLSILQEGLVTTVYPATDNRGVTDAREIASDKGKVLPCTVADSLYRMYGNLAAVARGDAGPWSSFSSAQANERVMSLILRSAAEDGRRLFLDDHG